MPILSIKQFKTKGFVDPEYELIALHPEHFLPPGNVLVVYSTTFDIKTYVVARDRVLRESSEPSSPRFPPFRHVTQSRNDFNRLNVFLVALNADIKFRRYFYMTRHNPPTTPLPNNLVDVMNRTIELMKLLYWVPVPTKGSQGEKLLAEELASTRKNLARGARPDRTKAMESSFSEEAEMDAGEGAAFLRSVNDMRSRASPWPEDADLETRMAIGRALMSDHCSFLVLSLSLFTHSEFTKMESMIQNYSKITHFFQHTVGPPCYFLSIYSLLVTKQHIRMRISQM